MTVEAFNEDKAIIEHQQDYISSDESTAPLIAFAFDKAGQSARRISAAQDRGRSRGDAAKSEGGVRLLRLSRRSAASKRSAVTHR